MPQDRRRQGRTRSRRNKNAKNEPQAQEQVQEEYVDQSAVQEEPQTTGPISSSASFAIASAHYGYVQPDLKTYLTSLEPILDNSAEHFADLEDQAAFVSNAFKEVEQNELPVATDPECSRILEKVLRLANDFQLRLFAARLQGRYHELFTHRFASHVCQTLLLLAADIMERELKGESLVVVENASAENTPELPSMTDIFLEICEFLSPYYGALMTDPYGTHILRVVLNILTGESIASDSAIRSKKSKKYNEKKNNKFDIKKPKSRAVAPQFATTLQSIVDVLTSSLDSIRIYTTHKLASPVLQFLVTIQARNNNPDVVFAILGCDSIETLKRDELVDKILKDTVGSHLAEVILQNVNDTLFHTIYVTYFRGRLSELSLHLTANFVVAALIKNIRNKAEFEIILQEMLDTSAASSDKVERKITQGRNIDNTPATLAQSPASLVEKLIKRGKHGIVVELCRGCVKYQTGYKDLMKIMVGALGLHTPEEKKRMVECLLYMQNYNRIMSFEYHKRSEMNAAIVDTPPTSEMDTPHDTQEPSQPSPQEHYKLPMKPSTPGTYILCSLLAFPLEQNRAIVDSLFHLTPTYIVSLCRDASGSTIMESFFKSAHVGLKAKRKLIQMLSGLWTKVATSKPGSHVIDALWAAIDLDAKEKFAEELVKDYNTLVNDFAARFVVRNCRLDAFKAGKEGWRGTLEGIQRKKDMFKEFLEDDDRVNNAGKEDDVQVDEETKVATERVMAEKLDDQLKALGFNGRQESMVTEVVKDKKKDKKKEKKEKTKDKKKKSKKSKETVESIALDQDTVTNMNIDSVHKKNANNAEDPTVVQEDEIDSLFKRKSVGGGAPKSTVKHEQSESTDEEEQTEKPTKSFTKVDKSLAGVLDAISATNEKKRKKANKRKNEDEDASSKKSKKSRKFMS